MKIVDKIPNLRTTQENIKKELENQKKELEKHNYYKKINDEDRQIINRRNEYYKFLLHCIQLCNENISRYDLNNSVYAINFTYTFEIFNADVVKEIKEFLQLNNIGEITEENHINEEHCEYTKIEIKFACSFEDFFKAFYSEIQYMEYYETTKEEAQKKYREFFERDEQRYREYINNHQEEIIHVLSKVKDPNIPANQVYRVIKMLEDNKNRHYCIANVEYVMEDLYKLGFTIEKIAQFTGYDEKTVEKLKQNGR